MSPEICGCRCSFVVSSAGNLHWWYLVLCYVLGRVYCWSYHHLLFGSFCVCCDWYFHLSFLMIFKCQQGSQHVCPHGCVLALVSAAMLWFWLCCLLSIRSPGNYTCIGFVIMAPTLDGLWDFTALMFDILSDVHWVLCRTKKWWCLHQQFKMCVKLTRKGNGEKSDFWPKVGLDWEEAYRIDYEAVQA